MCRDELHGECHGVQRGVHRARLEGGSQWTLPEGWSSRSQPEMLEVRGLSLSCAPFHLHVARSVGDQLMVTATWILVL